MPTYVYHCNSCQNTFEARHSMSFEGQLCKFCESLDVTRVPSEFGGSHKVSEKSNSKPGSVVREFIESTREEINKEKKDLKRREA